MHIVVNVLNNINNYYYSCWYCYCQEYM